jgi:hypothetical protein
LQDSLEREKFDEIYGSYLLLKEAKKALGSGVGDLHPPEALGGQTTSSGGVADGNSPFNQSMGAGGTAQVKMREGNQNQQQIYSIFSILTFFIIFVLFLIIFLPFLFLLNN